MTKYQNRVIGSTDVYSRKHIDRNIDRLERLYFAHKSRIRELEIQISELVSDLHRLRLGLVGITEAQAQAATDSD